MIRSLFVVEDECGGIWGVQRVRDAEFDTKVKRLLEYDPSAVVVEYIPRVRCDGCKFRTTNGGCMHGGSHTADWYCADHEEETP